MHKKLRLSFGDRRISIAALILVIFGSLMIASAEMGVMAGDADYLKGVIIRQVIYAVLGLLSYFILMNLPTNRFPLIIFYFIYGVIAVALLLCRAFGQINGAYAWIRLGAGATIQPSEFAKAFMIALAGRLFKRDHGEENRRYFLQFAGMAAFYVLIIFLYQHDFGSAVVLAVICYCMLLIPNYRQLKKYQMWMFFIMIGVVGLAFLAMSDPVTEFLRKHSSNYMVGRFLAAADPFLYQYDNGYHLIMSLVSFANGGLFGLGYGNSIHKYMNFPNPSNDFILPVIVEELGTAGFIAFIVTYGVMLYPLISESIRAQKYSAKIILSGVFIYFTVHFILNVGGVSGLIPLTGVPLLLISSGGSSMMASLMALGLAQAEIIAMRRDDEDNSRQVQEDPA